MSNKRLSEAFPKWRAISEHPDSASWASGAHWDNEQFLFQLLNLLEDDLEARFGQLPEEVTVFGAVVLEELAGHDPICENSEGDVQRSFVRFFLAVQLAVYCEMYGRMNLVFDWLSCALSDRLFTSIETGQPFVLVYYPTRLRQFLECTISEIKSSSPWTVLTFIRCLYYYSWKAGGLRDLSGQLVDEAQSIVLRSMESGDNDLATWGVGAASALSTWCIQGERPNAEIVQAMIEVYYRPGTTAEARKLVATTLVTSVGTTAGQSRVEWARRAVSEHIELLTQHEPVQMLIAACATPEEMTRNYDDIIAAIQQYTSSCDKHLSYDRAEIAFRRIQLFDLLIPFVVGLLSEGHCAKAVNATAAWFSVPAARRRTSPVLALFTGLADGVVYSRDGEKLAISQDSAEAQKRLIEAVNHAFDTSIVLRDDHRFPPHPKSGRRGELRKDEDELAEATASFYEVDRAADEIVKTHGLALFQLHAIPAPLVPLVRSRLGVTWPTVTSFEEPAPDRVIRRALIWSYGTILGGHEARAVAAILEAAGVECVLLIDKELTPVEFLHHYSDDSFDLLWVSAHGMFDPREPHLAHVSLSSDSSKPIVLKELVSQPVRGPGRRLLFLNVCLGANVAVTEAPPKLGLAAMLASAEQAVVSHVFEVSSFVAPLFGVGAAIPLARGESFLAAFSHALDAARLERDGAVELVRHAAPQCSEFLAWLENGTYGVEKGDIRSWGTGAFYE